MRRYKIFVYRTARHFYAQLIDSTGVVKRGCSTVSRLQKRKNCCNTESVKVLASKFASYLREQDLLSDIRYDCGRKAYKGLIKIFADSLREFGVCI